MRVRRATNQCRHILWTLLLLLPMRTAVAGSAPASERATPPVGYRAAFEDLYHVLGERYPCFALKGIDWEKAGEELLPRAERVESDEQFGLLCMELVARLEDSHSYLLPGTSKLPQPPMPQHNPGLYCLIDDRGEPVIYHVDRGGPAERAGVRPGMAVLAVNGKPAAEVLKECKRILRRYCGYSSPQCVEYHAARHFVSQLERGAIVRMTVRCVDGSEQSFRLPAMLGRRYLPRLPVPIQGIPDSANISWKMLDGQIGYIRVRRIQNGLEASLDTAVARLRYAKGLIVDVRGNSGGGFDGNQAFLNFTPKDDREPHRPRYAGPIVLLTDSWCISAGEGWASWFVANKRAKLFGEPTAGASSAKTEYTLRNGLYKVQFSIRPRKGYLERPIERIGLVPDVAVRPNARDLAMGVDTVIEAAGKYLLAETQVPSVLRDRQADGNGEPLREDGGE